MLRFIKTWAKINVIHSNNLGFLNGISWAVMVAKLCISNTKKSVWELISQFFTTYSLHDWSEAISIEPYIEETKENIKDAEKRYHIRIINPAYPYTNTWWNVSVFNKFVIQQNLQDAWNLTSLHNRSTTMDSDQIMK